MDSHVHTCLSPCAELDMHPMGIIDEAKRNGIDSIVICDHNSCENIGAVQRAGVLKGIEVIAGMEITTSEEVHIQAILPDIFSSLELQSYVYRSLNKHNDPNVFGMQVIVNEVGEVLGFCDLLLSGATNLTIEQTVEKIHSVGGLAIAAHCDRESFGLMGHLGFIPDDLNLDGIEVSRLGSLDFIRYFPKKLPVIRGSDAHSPEQIGKQVTFILAEGMSFNEFRLALLGLEGRMVLGGGNVMEDLCMHVLDIVQNSVEAGATRIEVELIEKIEDNQLLLIVRDNGKGISKDLLEKVIDPFYTTKDTRKVGLGLSLLKTSAESAQGYLSIDSIEGKGTEIKAVFQLDHVDRIPVGDIETTTLVILVGNPNLDFQITHVADGVGWHLSSEDVRAHLDNKPFSSPDAIKYIKAFVKKGESLIKTLRKGGTYD